MPNIIVTAVREGEGGEPPIMFRERVNVSDFESPHFARQLMERIGWAVGDADEVERRSSLKADRRVARRREADAAGRELARFQRTPRSARVVTTASYTPAP